jgi:hypothetical protein
VVVWFDITFNRLKAAEASKHHPYCVMVGLRASGSDYKSHLDLFMQQRRSLRRTSLEIIHRQHHFPTHYPLPSLRADGWHVAHKATDLEVSFWVYLEELMLALHVKP